jgi:phosphatidylserine decarboxylase
MVRDGIYYAGALLVVAVIVWYGTQWISLTAFPVLLAAFFLWFFRDPEREIPQEPGLIVSPGDGKVEEAEWIETTMGSRFRVSIFLSVVDVHVNRAPIGGTVTLAEYREGAFMNAMNSESAVLNEQTLITIDDGRSVVSFKQIAGLLARRIICDLKAGDVVQRGQRIGMIKFGSRVDVLMPADVELRVKPGDRVVGGSSVLGVLAGYDDGAAADAARGRS